MYRLQTVAGLRTYLRTSGQGQRIGLVPTMGALHLGHASLIRRAVAETDLVVVSIFVNPLQFGPQEDLSRYPRPLGADCELAAALGVGVVFCPSQAELGLDGNQGKTLVVPPATLTETLCGAYRPGHFTGVATMVSRLFQLVQPSAAYFGEKDAQQLAIVRRLVADLDFAVEIKGCPTVRDPSGLALSSRNQYLSEQEKQQAQVLHRSLQKGEQLFQTGQRDAALLLQVVQQELQTEPAVIPQYLALVDPQTLQPVTTVQATGLLALAAYLGQTRLIDNLLLRRRQAIIVIDGPAGAGKSTVTRQVANRLGLLYLDTGALYRALAWLVLETGIDPGDQVAVAEVISPAEIELIPQPSPHLTAARVNGQAVREALRSPEVTGIVSVIAAQKAVRDKLLSLQRHYGEQGGLVAEGRDLGTHIFPDAELKIFLTASVQERARRRLRDFQAQGKSTLDLAQLEQDIAQRDYLDSTRAIAPLKQAADAIEIVTDNLSIEAVIAKILALYQQLESRT